MAITLIEGLAVAQIVALLASGLLNVWLYFAMRNDTRWKGVTDSIAQGDAGLAGELQRSDRRCNEVQAMFERRLSVLETKVEAMPTHDDLGEIRDQLSRIDRSVAGLAERSESTQESVRRIERHLLESKR